MANTVCTSFKEQLLSGEQNLSSGGDTYKLALYNSSYTGNVATTTIYTTGNEVANSGTYSAGGGTLANQAVSVDGTTALVDFDDLSFTSATINARYALIYRDGTPTKAVCVLDFGAVKTSTSGTFTITFPAAEATAAIIRIA